MQRRMKCVVIFRRSRGKINAIARRCELSTEPRAGEIQDAAPARSDAAPARLCPRIRTAKATLSTLGGSWSARLAPCRPCSRTERARSRREQPAAPRRDNHCQPGLVAAVPGLCHGRAWSSTPVCFSPSPRAPPFRPRRSPPSVPSHAAAGSLLVGESSRISVRIARRHMPQFFVIFPQPPVGIQ